jgi:hypothetical protein
VKAALNFEVVMRKNILFKLCGQEITVPVDFDAIERIERGFSANADAIASFILPNMQSVAYTRLARVVAAVVSGHTDLKHQEIIEHIVQAPDKEIAQYALNLQIACLYLRKNIDDEAFDAYAAGKSPAKKLTGSSS